MATKATPSARARASKQRRDWRPVFLEGLASTGTVKSGCKLAKVHRSVAYRERERNEEFAKAWTHVEEEVTDKLEETALLLALQGETRLVEFLLKARRPEKYREHHKVEHSGPEGGPIAAETTIVDKRKRSDAARQYLATLAED